MYFAEKDRKILLRLNRPPQFSNALYSQDECRSLQSSTAARDLEEGILTSRHLKKFNSLIGSILKLSAEKIFQISLTWVGFQN